MSRRVPRTLLVLACLLMAVTSCRGATTRGRETDARVPITDRALAAVTAEHLGRPTRAQVEGNPYGLQHTIAAARIYYPEPSEDGDLVAVQVGTGLVNSQSRMCKKSMHDPARGGCFAKDGVWVTWGPGIPEEESGSIGIVAPRAGGVYVTVAYSPSEDSITRDPRTLDLTPSLDDLIALARDARIARTTTQATVEVGEKLDFWTFG